MLGATFNIYKRLSKAQKQDDMGDFFAFDPDLVFAGLQEINFDFVPPVGWDKWQPEGTEQRKDVVVWKTRTFRAVGLGSLLVSERLELEDRVFPARYANWAVLQRLSDGNKIAVISAHLNSDVGVGGTPNGTPQQTEHYNGIIKIIDLGDSLTKMHDCPVVLAADLNVDYSGDKLKSHEQMPYYNFSRAGYQCVWELGEMSTRTGNPYDGVTIDYGYARDVEFQSVRCPITWSPTDPVESDHLPVYFQFRPKWWAARNRYV